jgi:hypothetical protein
MDIENTSPVPVAAMVYAGPENAPRTAIFTAKATFGFSLRGEVELDREDPFPLFDKDEDTELGLLPSDALPRVDDVFEVMLLGTARPPRQLPVAQMTAMLGVGTEFRQLTVFGDRTWDGEGPHARIAEPRPFTAMPLTWAHAFGGRQEVLIDVESPVDVLDPVNPEGKGFDHLSEARLTGEVLKSPSGFPVFSPTRPLPNLEDPRRLIRNWDDRPLPACWAPAPLQSGLLVERLRRAQESHPDQPVTIGSPEVMHRAHPDWVIPVPPEGAPIELHGLLPSGPLRFPLPSLRVVLDVRIGEIEQQLELPPRGMVLLPDEQRFYVVFRHYLQYHYRAEETRTARVRLEPGWWRA